jgi:hypothetical protein
LKKTVEGENTLGALWSRARDFPAATTKPRCSTHMIDLVSTETRDRSRGARNQIAMKNED